MRRRGLLTRRLRMTAAALAGFLVAMEVSVRVAARVVPSVRYLATAGLPSDRPSYASFEDFRAAHTDHLIPHRPWFNYWNNRLGFNDQEFEVPKPAGRFRIMALGDSFAYGLLPYPDNVLTIVEDRLRTQCACPNLDLLNFGIGATGVEDYNTLLQLGHSTYEPDLVAVHFYMGNDGPNLYEAGSNDRWRRWLPRSYAGNYVGNVWQLRAVRFSSHPAGRPGLAKPPRGGAMIDPDQPPLTDRHPALSTPTQSDEGFLKVARSELFRLYAPADRAPQIERAWAPTLDVLDALRRTALDRGSRFVLVLFPSALQVYPTLRGRVLERLHERGRYTDVASEDIDATHPNRMLLGYCRRVNVPCIDVTAALRDAGVQSPEPLYRSNDTHWNIRGNRVAGEAEAAALGPIVCQEARSRC